MITHRDILSEHLSGLPLHFNRVLEIGAGGGQFDKVINHDFYIKTDLPQVDVHNIPYRENSFDCVFMSHAFEHFLNPILALSEIKRVLIPGGKVIIVTPFHCKHQILGADRDHIFCLTEMQFKRILTYSGFNNIKVTTQTKFQGKQIAKEQDYNTFAIGEK